MNSPISFLNTGIPAILIGAVALILPLAVIRRDTRSHAVLWRGLVVCSLIMLCVSAVTLAVLDVGNAPAFFDILGQPRLSLLYVYNALPLALVWLPLLALAWISRALLIERLRGEDKMRDGRGS